VLLSGYYNPTVRADALLVAPAAAPVVGDVLRYTVSPLFGAATLPLLVKGMFAPLPVPERFRNGFSHGMALRPWQIRAEAQDGATMAFGVAAMRDHYPDLRMPVAIMVGSEDRVVDVGRHSIRLHEQIPHSELRVVPGVGHMVHHAVPDEVAQMIETIAGGSSGRGRLTTRSTAAAGPGVAAEVGAAA
jgi:pimeloyl-ACP methyl ester carboxylesterase